MRSACFLPCFVFFCYLRISFFVATPTVAPRMPFLYSRAVLFKYEKKSRAT